VLEAVGVPADEFEIDGTSLLSHVTSGEEIDERPIFWEMNGQTAVRRGKWKLVIDGQLVEEAEPIHGAWLSDLSVDSAETTNLADSEPAIRDELERMAREWRAGIESRWERDYASLNHGSVTHSM
jgi:arylsulfatase A-like enzyme